MARSRYGRRETQSTGQRVPCNAANSRELPVASPETRGRIAMCQRRVEQVQVNAAGGPFVMQVPSCKCRTCDNCGKPFAAVFWWQCCCSKECYAAYLGVETSIAALMFNDSASVEG